MGGKRGLSFSGQTLSALFALSATVVVWNKGERMPPTRREQLRSAIARASLPWLACPQPPLSSFAEALHGWTMQRCVFRDRSWGGVVSLHRNYAMWCVREAGDIPCLLSVFQQWLAMQGFHVERGLVYGLLLKADFATSTEGKGSISLCGKSGKSGKES
jgi:hypothetical protein